MRLFQGDLRRADAVHLPGADAQRPAVLHRHDGVRLHVLDDVPAEIQVRHLLRGGLRLRHAHIRRHGLRRHVEVLHQQTAVDAHILFGIDGALLHVDFEQTQVLFRREHFESALVEFRGHDDFEEDRLHQLGGLLRHRAVRGHNTAEDRHLVGLVSLGPRLHDILARSRAAGIHVFQTHAERLVELAHDAQRGVGVLNIVVRQLLAVKLFGERQRVGNLPLLAVELGRLVGVLAVAQRLHEVELEEQLFIQTRLSAHVGGDHRIVFGGVRVGFRREFQARGLFGIAAGPDLGEDLRIVRGVAHDRHVGPVLGRRTQHRRTADVDVLDGILHLHAGLLDRLTERIEVHADHVDELDMIVFQGFQVLRVVAAGQQAAVHVRVQGLHTAVADLGKSRNVADVDHLHAAVGQQLHRAARGDHLPAKGLQPLGELHDTGFVAYAY